MKPAHLAAGALALTLASSAFASSFVVTTDSLVRGLNASTNATSDGTSSLRDSKVVLQAREDAASYVASGGAIRGARLESALVYIREQQPYVHATDTQLAQAILASQ